MSRQYSDTTNKNGLLQGIEQTIYGPDGDGRITGNTTLKALFTGELNQALDYAFGLIFKADGRWQFDDSNHSDYPILTTNLVAGQRDYSFTTDGNSNLILHVHKVLCSNASGVFFELDYKDQQSNTSTEGFWDGQNTQGVPSCYDKTANGIFLDPVPATSITNGLKIFVSREASYFTTSDTTKKPGIAGIFHEYLIVRASYQYAYRNGLQNVGLLRDEMLRIEKAMTEYYAARAKDERQIMTPKKILYV